MIDMTDEEAKLAAAEPVTVTRTVEVTLPTADACAAYLYRTPDGWRATVTGPDGATLGDVIASDAGADVATVMARLVLAARGER